MRSQIVRTEAKVEVLLMYWNKVFTYLMDASKINKDKLTINLVNRLIEVPKEIKVKCLKKYVSKCKELHTIAFL